MLSTEGQIQDFKFPLGFKEAASSIQLSANTVKQNSRNGKMEQSYQNDTEKMFVQLSIFQNVGHVISNITP